MLEVLQKLKDAITQYDVNATIQDEDVKLWNEIIKAGEELEKEIKRCK